MSGELAADPRRFTHVFEGLTAALRGATRSVHRLMYAGPEPRLLFEETITDLLIGCLLGTGYDVTSACPCGNEDCNDWNSVLPVESARPGAALRELSKKEESGDADRGATGADLVIVIPSDSGNGEELRLMVQAKRAVIAHGLPEPPQVLTAVGGKPYRLDADVKPEKARRDVENRSQRRQWDQLLHAAERTSSVPFYLFYVTHVKLDEASTEHNLKWVFASHETIGAKRCESHRTAPDSSLLLIPADKLEPGKPVTLELIDQWGTPLRCLVEEEASPTFSWIIRQVAEMRSGPDRSQVAHETLMLDRTVRDAKQKPRPTTDRTGATLSASVPRRSPSSPRDARETSDTPNRRKKTADPTQVDWLSPNFVARSRTGSEVALIFPNRPTTSGVNHRIGWHADFVEIANRASSDGVISSRDVDTDAELALRNAVRKYWWMAETRAVNLSHLVIARHDARREDGHGFTFTADVIYRVIGDDVAWFDFTPPGRKKVHRFEFEIQPETDPRVAMSIHARARGFLDSSVRLGPQNGFRYLPAA